jgi:arsenate reductase
MRVLVLCTGNSCRSQIAEGYLRVLSNAALEVYSAGLTPKGVHPRAIQIMAEDGIDISSHTSNDLREYLSNRFDFIITVCDNAAEQCPVFPGDGTRLHWPFHDPAHASGTESEILAEFRTVRDQIKSQCREWIASLNLTDTVA